MRRTLVNITLFIFCVVNFQCNSFVTTETDKESKPARLNQVVDITDKFACKDYLIGKSFKNLSDSRIEFEQNGLTTSRYPPPDLEIHTEYWEILDFVEDDSFIVVLVKRHPEDTYGWELHLTSEGKIYDESTNLTEIPDILANESNHPVNNSTSIKNDQMNLETHETISLETRKYCSPDGSWIYEVSINGNEITIKKFAGESNTAYQDKKLPKDVIKGKIDNENVILTKDENGEMAQLFKISNGMLIEAGYEGTENHYTKCN